MKIQKKKEREIQNLGYNLITIWESDWIKINKYIQLIQKNFVNLSSKLINLYMDNIELKLNC